MAASLQTATFTGAVAPALGDVDYASGSAQSQWNCNVAISRDRGEAQCVQPEESDAAKASASEYASNSIRSNITRAPFSNVGDAAEAQAH